MRRTHLNLAVRAAGALALIAAAGLAQPASAGDLAELECAIAGLSQADGAALVGGIERGETSARNNAAVPVAADVVSACRQRFDWNREEHRAASHYVPAFFGKQRFRAMLEGRDLDLAAIERMVVADSALIAAAVALRRDPPELDAFFRRLDPSVIAWVQRHSNDGDLLHALGGFIAATALVEGMRVRFARS